MRASALKSEDRYKAENYRSIGIRQWGDRNDYIEKSRQIRSGSPTGSSCNDIYAKFIAGDGLLSQDLMRWKVGKNTVAELIAMLSNDFTDGGFVLHVNWNAAFEVVMVNHIPLEHIRFSEQTESGTFEKFGVHPNFAGYVENIKIPRNKKEIVWIDKYNPTPSAILTQVEMAGGWENYNGQILYYSNRPNEYPLPIYDSVLTDMSTQEGVSNVGYRNARMGFQGAGIMVDKTVPTENEEQMTELERALMEWQGDQRSCKIMYVQIKNEDEKPEFISTEVKNFDRAFELTEKTVKSRIGERYMQPPIIRGENVGATFGADLMINAYDFYNSVTDDERYTLSEKLLEVLRRYFPALPIAENEAIQPKKYITTPITTQ